MVMTIHPLHGGDGYEYLTRQVATADRERGRMSVTDYYNEHGTPPGVWSGRGAEIMGVSGDVNEAQMRALYGEGLHPDADLIFLREFEAGATAEQALAAGRLGTGFYRFAGGKTPITEIYERRKAEFIAAEHHAPTRDQWIDLRTESAREYLTAELERPPSVEEIKKALFDEKRKARQAVVGWDCTFTPQKSVSILWGLADDDTRRSIWRAHEEAVREVLERMEDNYALARRGRGGSQLIDTEGLTFAKFMHFDNRTGDMNPHTHVVVSSRVLGSDGKWSSLRADALLQATVSLSSQYNAAITGKLKRELGLRFEERSRGRGKEPVLEVVGISNAMINEFSRRGDIVARTEELVKQYREIHGQNPGKAAQIKIAQQATLDTREGKPLPKTLRQMIGEWNERATAFLDDGRTGEQFAADIVRLSRLPELPQPYDRVHAAVAVGVELGGRQATLDADPDALLTVVDDTLRRYDLSTLADPNVASDEVLALLNEDSVDHVLDTLDEALAARNRVAYDPARIAGEVLEKVSGRRATWVETHIRSAVEDRLAVCDFAGHAEHRAAVEYIVSLVRDQHSTQLTIDPDEVPQALARRNGENVFSPLAATTVRYTSDAVLAADKRLQDASQAATAEILTRAAVDRAIDEVEEGSRPRKLGVIRGKPRRLKQGQRRIVEHFCSSGARLAVAVGPAGTGKTTAMRAVVKAWEADGRNVIALSPQMSNARVLGDEIGVRAQTIDSLITKAKAGVDVGITRGTMILVDEAGMASNFNLDALQTIADEHGAVVRWIGDPYQLSAVDSGGVLRLIANDTNAPELDEVVRFEDPAEAEASLEVRKGDAQQAWEFYNSNSRVHSGMADELREQMLTAHLADTGEGKTSLMMAATLTDVYALNGAAQAAHILRDDVDSTGPHTKLADGHKGFVGDTIVTRRNNSEVRISGRGRRVGSPIDNGDLWRITGIRTDGTVIATGIGHGGQVALAPRYIRDHTELGYASTVHRAQGMTVDRAHLLMNTTLGRALAYVGLTRGKALNAIYVATDMVPDPDLDRIPDEPAEAKDVFLRVLAREDDNLTATEVMRAEQQRIADPARSLEMFEFATTLLGRAHAEHLLDRALPVVMMREITKSEHCDDLLDTIAVADALGMNSGELVATIVTRNGQDPDGASLITARDTASMLRARADTLISRHIDRSAGARTMSGVETLAYSPATDVDALNDMVAALNTAEVVATTQRGGRFMALRDVEFPGVRPVPSRYPGADIELAEFAEMLRGRLVGATVDPLRGNRPSVPRTDEDKQATLDNYASATTTNARRDKIERDYTFYVEGLGRDRARHLLDRALPSPMMRTVEASRRFTALLDTIAVADANRLDTAAMVQAITERNLTRARDAAAVLRARADEWIAARHIEIPDTTPIARTATLSLGDATEATLTDIVAATSSGVDVLAYSPRNDRFRALDDLGWPKGLRPIPPEHPGMETAVADHADELRRLLLDLPDDAPDWRDRAESELIRDAADELDDEVWTPTAQELELPYPELSAGERLQRIRADLAAAQEQESLLFAAAMDDTSPHAQVIEPIVAALRQRRDELVGLVNDLRNVQAEWDAAVVEAAAADDIYQQQLRVAPSAIDEGFLAEMTEIIAEADDPAIHAQLTAALDELRAAELDRADSNQQADIAMAKLVADSARAWAEQLRGERDAAQAALDEAAGGRPAVDWRDVLYVQQLAGELAVADLSTARERAVRLSVQARRARLAAITELVNETGMDTTDAAVEVDRRFAPTRDDIDAAMPTVLGRDSVAVDSLAPLDSDELVDAAVESGRRRAFTSGPVTTPLEEEPLTALVRARADALMPAAVAALSSSRAADEATTRMEGAEADLAKIDAREVSEFDVDEPFVAQMRTQIAALAEADPARTQLTAMLAQYQESVTESATQKIDAAREEAGRTAAAARAHADELNATAERARRAFDERLAALIEPTRDADRRGVIDLDIHGDPDTTPSAGDQTADVAAEAAAEAGEAVDEAPTTEAATTDSVAAHEAEVLAELLNQPMRLRSDADLASLISRLRRAATRRDDPALWAGLANSQTATAQVRAAHEQLQLQATAIETAQRAQQNQATADRAVTGARTSVTESERTLAGLPAIRVGARRAEQARLDDLQAEKTRTEAALQDARARTRAAIDAARQIGAPEALWPSLLARAADRAALAQQLAEAQAADERDEQQRHRAAERAAAAAEQLTTALAERDRRIGLTPMDAATEQRLRTIHGPAGTGRTTGPTQEEHAAQVEAQRQRGRDHGPEL
ncbi:MobF family relaxase [Nocardia salmonicida]|uniref:MobF family relaxase n=1 Tax=Nocardia salmonicida TaxID=53431 RepID=UPI0034074C81